MSKVQTKFLGVATMQCNPDVRSKASLEKVNMSTFNILYLMAISQLELISNWE